MSFVKYYASVCEQGRERECLQKEILVLKYTDASDLKSGVGDTAKISFHSFICAGSRSTILSLPFFYLV